MSLLSEYKERTKWKNDPIPQSFPTHEDLTRKVKSDGGFAPFFGSTVVFKAENNCIDVIRKMQEKLYQELEGKGILAEELPASTIHMTLHDLISPEMCTSDPNESAEEYNHEVDDSITKARKVADAIKKENDIKEIHLVADRIVCMVRKSLVLLLLPKMEEDIKQLMELYKKFEYIKKLPYDLTLHITLAYLRPSGPDEINGNALSKAVELAHAELFKEQEPPTFTFRIKDITVQRFENMKTYIDV